MDLQLDPKFNLDRQVQELMSDAELANGVPYDEDVKLMIKYYNWENPARSSVLTANNTIIFFNVDGNTIE